MVKLHETGKKLFVKEEQLLPAQNLEKDVLNYHLKGIYRGFCKYCIYLLWSGLKKIIFLQDIFDQSGKYDICILIFCNLLATKWSFCSIFYKLFSIILQPVEKKPLVHRPE